MLEQFREFANKRIVRILFALFLVIPFGLFGIDFYFRTPVGGDTLASVGHARIGQTEFDQALREQGEMYRRQLRGQFDPSILENPEVRRSVLDGLVSQKLVSIGAERAGGAPGGRLPPPAQRAPAPASRPAARAIARPAPGSGAPPPATTGRPL